MWRVAHSTHARFCSKLPDQLKNYDTSFQMCGRHALRKGFLLARFALGVCEFCFIKTHTDEQIIRGRIYIRITVIEHVKFRVEMHLRGHFKNNRVATQTKRTVA